MRVAHFSDLHLLDLEGAVPGRLFNKRFTGWVNIRLRRGHKHKPEPVRIGARKLAELGVDHVVVTGDVSNLSLEREFDLARELFEVEMGFHPDQISVVPGNHDAYTRGAFRTQRFAKWFHDYTSSDLPITDDRFPFVRLRGPLAIIGLSTAVPHPPFVAAGRIGDRQLERLGALLEHDEVKKRTVLLLQHHPPVHPGGRIKTLLEGLWDGRHELAMLDSLSRGLLLHGHWHVRKRVRLPTKRGEIEVIGATSASLLHEDERKMAGFNLYDFDRDGALVRVSTQRFSPSTQSFDHADLEHHHA